MVLFTAGMAAAENGGSGANRDAWIEERLRAIENQFNSGIMPISFVEGYIPWEDYFTVSGQPKGVTEEDWLKACHAVSDQGYNVDNTGVKYTKFPQYDEKGIHFASVTVNGVEVVRAGILMPDNNDPNSKPVYYYLTQKHVDSDSSDGSGSHTGSISALLLPENAKFQVNYAVNEYKYSYEIRMADKDGKIIGEDISGTLSPEKDKDGNLLTWEQFVFGGQNPSSTTNGAISFPVTIPYGYTAKVYRYNYNEETEEWLKDYTELTGDRGDLKEEPDQQEAKIVNEGYALGTEPTYKGDTKGVYLAENSPSAKRMSAVFFDDQIKQNRRIVVALIPDEKDPIFDAHWWLQTGNASDGSTGRGTVAKNEKVTNPEDKDDWWYEPKLMNRTDGKGGNIESEDGWNWNSSNNPSNAFNKDPGTLGGDAENNYGMHWYKDKDDTWTLVWAFQTNSSNDFIMNSLELNGTYIDIPFKPHYNWVGDINGYDQEAGNSKEEYTKTATLPDGAKVELTYYRYFFTSVVPRNPQRVYILTITGARSNVTITGGNLMQYGNGAPEYVATVLSGVTAKEDGVDSFGYYSNYNTWEIQNKVTIQVQEKFNSPTAAQLKGTTNFDGDPNRYFANLRFQLQTGYENPVYLWQDRVSGDDLEGNRSENGTQKDGSIIPWSDVSQYLDGDKLKTGYIYGPVVEDDGEWYYIRISEKNKPQEGVGNHKMCVLNLTATAMRYMVRYMVGKEGDPITNSPSEKNGNVQGMPEFSTDNDSWDDDLIPKEGGGLEGEHLERYDDNNGSFYDRQTTSTIPISDATPTTKDGKKFFLYWVLVDKDERPIKDKNDKYIIVHPNTTIDLATFAKHGVSLNQDIGGTDNNYYVIRLKGVWSDEPTDFKFYIRMVWTDQESGQSHVMDLVQNVTTSATDENLIKNDLLVVTVNTVTDTFTNWFRLHPFYAYAARNYIPTAERPDDWLVKGVAPSEAWEAYPTDFTEGSMENEVPNPNAYYRVVSDNGIVKYEVQREGTIVLYLEPANGSLPVTKTITGSNPGDDTFTYTVTVHLLQADINRSTLTPGVDPEYLSPESLLYMLPDGTYFGMSPDASMTNLADFMGADVVLNFHRNATYKDLNHVTPADMAGWYSTATFTLQGGEATVLGVPQGSYTIVEAKDDGDFKYEVTINGEKSATRTASQVVKVGETTQPVHFGNAVKITNPPYKLKIGKKIVDLDGRGVDVDALVGDFDFEISLTSRNGQYVTMPGNVTASITTNGSGMGEGSFDEISFSHTGTYTFLVTETEYDAEKYLPTPSAHSVTMTVENLNGQLTVTKITVDKTVYAGDDENAKVEFTNTYIGNIKEAFVVPKVYKKLKGRSTLPAGMFEFTLEAAPNNPEGMTLPDINTATNGNSADGSVVFEPVLFEKPGVYTVEVKEKNAGLKGIEYDDRTVTITYTVGNVEENGVDVLKVTNTAYAGGTGVNLDTFENQAYADAGFDVIKNYDLSKRPGGSWENDTFAVTATLISAAGGVSYNGNPISVGAAATITLTQQARNGRFNFRFNEEGTYTFEVRETNTGLPGVSYDSSVYDVTVTVTPNGEEMNAAVSITKNGKRVTGDAVTFDNKYDPGRIDVTVNAKKILRGMNGQPINLTAGRFRFQLIRNGGQTSGLTSSNDAKGDVTFTLKDLEVGEYTYTLREINDGEVGVNYDDTVYTVIVKVEVQPGAAGPSAAIEYAQGSQTVSVPEFTNTISAFGKLTVSNTVTGSGAELDREFTYTFTFSGQSETYQYELRSSDSANGLRAGGVMPLFAPETTATTGIIRNGGTISLRHGQSVTISGLQAGTAYTVVESDYAPYTVSHDAVVGDTASGVIGDGDTAVNYTNTLNLRDPNVTISKAQSVGGVSGSPLTVKAGDTVTYTLTVKNEGEHTAENVVVTDAVPAGLIIASVDNGGQVNGNTVTWVIGELPGGASRTVSFTATVAAIAENQTMNNIAGVMWNGDMTGNTSDPVSLNAIAVGRLVVSKTVTGAAGELDKAFRFMAEIGGQTYQFTLKNGESWTSEDFEVGTAYRVTELDANADGYTTTVPANAVGTIPGNQTASVAFINNRESGVGVGSLTVRKQVTGNAGDTQTAFTFMVMLSDTSLNGTYGDMVFSKGVATFTLKHGESKTASGLPAGARYSVSEQAANQDGYATAATGESGMIAADTTATAIFVNAKDVAEVPKTGDKSPLKLWMLLAFMSLAGLAAFGKKKG